jgi:acetyltransferase-like isoleucine patch superfamily enzyme
MIKKYYNRIWRYVAKKSLSSVLSHSISQLKSKGLLEIGDHTYGLPIIDRYEGSDAKVTIGKFCSIGPNVRIITGGIHPVDRIGLYPFRIQWSLPDAHKDGMPKTNGPINIGNDVWISSGATILSGITIGHGSVIAANALVTKDVPPYTIVGGNPAKIVKQRFTPEQIDQLLKLEWWSWSREKIEKNINLISSQSVEDLLNSESEK